MKMRLLRSSHGFTLVEFLVTILLGIIVMMALVFPFAAEKASWRTGTRQAEAQRDAQFVIRYMEQRLRAAATCNVTSNIISFQTTLGGPTQTFRRDAALPNKFIYNNGAGTVTTLIDAVRSSLGNFTVTKTVIVGGSNSSMLTVNLSIIYRGEFTENLQTMIYLRNAP